MDLNNKIIYQIYPTSFYDGNGDGIGDLKGISEKLPYVKSLGADIIWLNPVYKSPFKDGGYDIIDHCAIDKKFGTMEDFDSFLSLAHESGIKVVMDLVVGHTSDKHAWFKMSKRPKRNAFSDYYIWTNSVFVGGDNAIKGMAKRAGNYMVNYYAFQPALNYGFVNADADYKMHYTDSRLKPLREEVLNIIKFWFERGVDGFRVDLAGNMIKGGRNLTALKWFYGNIIGEAKRLYPENIFMAEWGVPEQSTECGFDIDYINHESKGYNEIFRSDKGSNIMPAFEKGNSYFSKNAKGTKLPLMQYLQYLTDNLRAGAYYAIPSGFHDMVRISKNRDADALKCVFAFLLTFKNVPLIYYGDEIGLKHNFKVNKDGGYIRTGARTPMQWTNGKNRGFSDNNKIYLPVEKSLNISVESQEKDAESLLNTVKTLIKIRKRTPALLYDAEYSVDLSKEYPLVYTRRKDNQKILVAINPSGKPVRIDYKIKKAIYGNNYELSDGIELKAQGFIIAEL